MRASSRLALLVTCEHGGREVPRKYGGLLQGHEDLLASHRGFDPGALELARRLSRTLGAPLLASTVTRLLVDPNRSPGHRKVFSELSRALPVDERRRLLAAYHRPHWRRVEATVESLRQRGRTAVHLGVHTFTPILQGETRTADVGLLYDPARTSERRLCLLWQSALLELAPGLRVRRNYPYRGTADGLTTQLRRRYPEGGYLGIELEVNQRHHAAGGAPWLELQDVIAETLGRALAGCGRGERLASERRLELLEDGKP